MNSRLANAIAAARRFDELEEGRPDVPSPSRLFIYYNERMLAVAATNSPVPLRDGHPTIAKPGACPDTMRPDQAPRCGRHPTPGC